ncbi:hypothetical protein BKK81_23470 [Cupriavidus sp. USMAHM13]|uniref:flagellar brake domain-containing protein n=1 Tax=Cupriavidus sp. USMAHM13 TaxID=1389192 RepID=UPI0008A6897A|nr:flagellar brake protein [Cupriavidus sp. USMAHM13]AOZ02247.1 hypothetical protein BKK81_23470 [Cupriavidus sp. USMAHM13]
MRREAKASDIELGQPLKSALLDELGFPIADQGTVFHNQEELALAMYGGRCFWADDMEPLGADEPASPLGDRYGLVVGTLLHVKRPGDASRAAASRLIGFTENAAFIAWPKLEGRNADALDGETVLLRGFTGTSIHSFSARVKASSGAPFPYWMLDEIKHIDAREMRGSIRVPVRIAGTLSMADGSAAPETVLITDLSLGGASLMAASAALTAPGKPVQLAFTLRAAGRNTRFVLDALTRDESNTDESGPFHCVGVAFDAYDEREALLLRSFIHEQLLESATLRTKG